VYLHYNIEGSETQMTKRTKTTNTGTGGKFYGYVRVSTDRQAREGVSLAEQESRIRGYAQSLGLKDLRRGGSLWWKVTVEAPQRWRSPVPRHNWRPHLCREAGSNEPLV
jgi:hypothetical protein